MKPKDLPIMVLITALITMFSLVGAGWFLPLWFAFIAVPSFAAVCVSECVLQPQYILSDTFFFVAITLVVIDTYHDFPYLTTAGVLCAAVGYLFRFFIKSDTP